MSGWEGRGLANHWMSDLRAIAKQECKWSEGSKFNGFHSKKRSRAEQIVLGSRVA